jgi:hypothetical protein
MTTRDRLKTPPHWNALHQHTYEAIFRNPAAHDLEWHDVRSLLTGLANVAEGHNGSLEVTRNGQLLILHAPKHKEFATAEELLAIRRLLEQSGEAAIPPPAALGADLLVVIDHHEAKIYRTELRGAVPQHLAPYDPQGFRRHLHSHIEETDGKRRPEQKSFYEAVASTLRGANRILIFGSGTGESSAMGQLLADLKHNHIDVAKHIVGSIVIDGHHLTEGQLLAQAREVFASKGD